MKKIKAALGYRILLLFATISKKYEVHQGALMLKYVEKISGLDKDLVDYDKENDLVLKKSTKEIIKAFMNWLNIFKLISTTEERADLMYFAYRIVDQDNKIDSAEKQLFRRTGKILGMPSDELMASFVI